MKMHMNKIMLLGACLFLGLGTVVSADTFSTKDFSVEVPQEGMEIADIEADEDSISFYESQSHESGMGFVGSIELYDESDDYASLNYTWGGAILNTDGTEKQVVIRRPSDVQMDFSREENIDRYHALYDLLLDSILPSLKAFDGEYLSPSQVKHGQVYDETLAQLAELIEAKASEEELEAAGFSKLYAGLYEDEDALKALQVVFVDLKKTGFPEMAIQAEDGSRIYDLFAQRKGEVLHLLSGTENDILQFYGFHNVPGNIGRTRSDAPSYIDYTFYTTETMTKKLIQNIRLIYDEAAEDGPYLCQYVPDEEAEALSEEEWTIWKANYGEVVLVPGSPLFE